MRAMKDSGIEWIGRIPRAWQVVRVKHLATQKDSLFLDGDWINSDVITTEGIRYLTSGNVGDGAYKEQGNGHISEETFEKQNCLKAFPGDLMISRLNEPVGRCCIIPEGHPFYVVAVDNVILRPDDGYNKKFIMYCMNTQGYAHAALMAASGTTMVRISRTSLGNLTIPVASVEEQKRIVEYLDTKCAEIDALITAKEKTNALLKERRQSIIYEAVTKGLNPDAPMKDSGIEWIGQIPENWSTVRVKYTGSYKSGNTITAADVKESGNFPVYGGNGLRGYTDEITHDGDHLLIGRQGALCGNVHMVSGKFWASEHAVVGTINANYAIRFLFYVLDVFDLNRLSTSAAQPGISVEQITGVVIPCPTFVEQQEIANVLDAKCAEVDELISANEATIQKLKEYRQSIIYEAVTGKIEV